MMSGGRSNGLPFTASQWQELEHQALVYKYMVSGMSIPPDLLFIVSRSLDSAISSKFLLQAPQQIGWNGFHMGFGRKIDPEPGRCRRTDGKKWRCSKEAYPDSKYCERHMHRGRNRSRKPVEIQSQASTTSPPSAIPINTTSVTRNTEYSPSAALPPESHFFYPRYFSSSRPTGIGLSSSQENTTRFSLESTAKDFRSSLPFFSEANSNSGFRRTISSDSSVNASSWQLAPQTLGFSMSQIKDKAYPFGLESGQQLPSLARQQIRDSHHYYNSHIPLNAERDDQPKKAMHHFIDEWPPKDKDYCSNSEDNLSSNRTQLSISMTNSLHDFFMTPKW